MTTIFPPSRQRDFYTELNKDLNNLKESSIVFSPVILEEDEAQFNAVSKDKSVAVTYFLKHFFFALVFFSTIWSMGQENLPESSTGKIAFIPNVSKNALSVQYAGTSATITMEKLDDIAPGDKLRLLGKNNESADLIVQCVRGNYFTVEGITLEKFGDHIYVYGKEVQNFKTVDYDAVTMMNFSSIRKLSKIEEAQQAEIIALKKEVAELHQTMNKMLVLLQEQHAQLATLQATASTATEVITPAENLNGESSARGTRFIPNIYKKASSVSYDNDNAVITVEKLEDIKPGDKIKIYNERNESYETIVSTVNGNCFTIENIPHEMFGENVFVYGKEITELVSVGL
jgi:hypothetical protein